MRRGLLVVEASKGPEFVIPPGTGGAPGRLTTPNLETVKAEVEKARRLVSGLNPAAANRAGRQRTRRKRTVRKRCRRS